MCLRQVILALALLPLSLQAQLTPVSNVVLRGGIAPGYTELQTNGMIRYNPASTNLEFYRNGSWTNIGTGSGSGTGQGFPLTNSPFANVLGSNTSFGVFDFGFLSFLNSTNLLFYSTNDNRLTYGSESLVYFSELTSASNALSTRLVSVESYTNRAANALDSNVWAVSDSTTNYQSRLEFVAFSNDINTRLIGIETFTNTYATADSTTNYASRVDYIAFTNTYATADSTTNYVRRTGDTFTGPVTGTTFNVSTLEVNDNFRYRGTNALTKAYLMHDGTNIAFQYAPREIWNANRFAQAITSNEFVYPGQQLLWPNTINFQLRDDMFQLKQIISPLVYTNADYPTPANTAFWDLVLRQGRDGSQGIPGEDGSANIFYQGIWSSSNANFTFSPTSYTWVSYQGQIYNLLDDSGVSDVPDVSPSNWQVIVSRGTDAIVTTVSNLVDRGVWNSFTAYTNLDLVIYAGNTFYVDSTNAPPGTNNAPVINSDSIGQDNAYWTVRTSRGIRGLQGLKGDDGIDGVDGAVTYITNIFNTFTDIIFDTNDFRFVNNPSTTNRIPVFLISTNGTNAYEWAEYTPVGTNNLTVSNNLLYLNGELAGGSARLTSAWSVVYSDANTNSVSLPLGASNTVLRSTGPASDPVWAVLDDLSWKTQPVSANYTSVSYNFVLADTTSSDIFITLPSASVNSGKVVAARKMVSDNTLFVKSEPGDLVQGVGTVGVVRAGSVIEVISTGGTDWWLK